MAVARRTRARRHCRVRAARVPVLVPGLSCGSLTYAARRRDGPPLEISERNGYQARTVEKWETQIERAQSRGLLTALLDRWRGLSRGRGSRGTTPSKPLGS